MTLPPPALDNALRLMPGVGREVSLSADDVLKPYVWIFYAAFLVSYLMTPLMRRVAIYYGIVDRPDGLRKMHREPVAYLGGVAVFLGWLVGVVVSQACQWHLDEHWVPALGAHVFVPLALVVGAFLVVLLGLYDDLFHIGAYWKIGGQVLAAATLLSAGIGDDLARPFVENVADRLPRFAGVTMPLPMVAFASYAISCGLTVSIVVFCCNASNLMDGLDGLAGGVTAIIGCRLPRATAIAERRRSSKKLSTTKRPIPASSPIASSASDLLLPCIRMRSGGNCAESAVYNSPADATSSPKPSSSTIRAIA